MDIPPASQNTAAGSGYVIAVYIAFCAVVSTISALKLPDDTNKDISEKSA